MGFTGSTTCASGERLSGARWISITSSFNPAEFSFPSLTAFLAGQLGDYSGNLAFRQGAGEFKNNRNIFAGLYIQDNFRVSRRLTLNLGLRYEPFLPWHETKGRVQQFRLPDFSGRCPSPNNSPTRQPESFFLAMPECRKMASGPAITTSPRASVLLTMCSVMARPACAVGFGIFYDTRLTGIINNRFVDQTPFSPQFILSTLTGAVKPGSFSDPLCIKATTQTALGCTSQSGVYPFPATFPPPANTAFTLNQLILSWGSGQQISGSDGL